MFRFLEIKHDSFGLDISQNSLKLVKLEKRGKLIKLASFKELEFKKGIIEEGEIKNEDALTKEIKKFLQKTKIEKIKNKNVIASLPEKRSFLQVIKMPKMDIKELGPAIHFEAENYIPFPIEKTYLDFQIVEDNPKLNYFNILIAASPKKIVDSYFFCLDRAGLNVQAMEIESQSIARALIKNGFSLDPVLMIDIGKNSTSFIIFNKKSIRFTSSVPFCSNDLTEAIADSLKIEKKDAEKLKIRYGLKRIKSKESTSVVAIVSPFFKNLTTQIRKYIDYYENHSENEKIKKIILCGRGSNLKGLTDFFSQELKILTTIANPWVNILPEDLNQVPGLSFGESIGYATALGLALRGISHD